MTPIFSCGEIIARPAEEVNVFIKGEYNKIAKRKCIDEDTHEYPRKSSRLEH